ncbi:hypothetical protein ABTY61_02485 [Kitasatospora sp. NPDC096128]|uniref:hypothetical protein n=1 Tax=Kitasatospora sp. NPDC096128 TaxID=3155547 RepID=UPI00332DEFB6
MPGRLPRALRRLERRELTPGRVREAVPPRTGADTVEGRVGAAEALFARAEARDAEGAVAALTDPFLLEPRR